MPCPDENAVLDFFDDQLPAEEAADVERHMARCTDCRRLFSRLAHALEGDRSLPGAVWSEGEGQLAAPDGTPTADPGADDGEGLDHEPRPAAFLSPGNRVSHFEVIRLVGRGGMGAVYLARDLRLGRKVALKMVLPDRLGSREAVERFVFEARTTARFSHPHIVTIYEVGEARGQPYLALEYLQGQSLRDRLNHERFTFQQALRTGLAIAEALAEAHDNGILHRDLKPGNVILARDGRLRVVDFGLAMDLGQERAASGAPGAVQGICGSPPYMAPEQWRRAEITGAADVWALGMMLYIMISGQHPYAGARRDELARQVSSDQPVPPVDRLQPVPGPLQRLVGRCLDKDPANRPSAAEVAVQIQALMGGIPAQLAEGVEPYRGLLPFDERHRHFFFGREAEITFFVERLREEPVLPVVGASGAGKSSFVQAGVIPRLRENCRLVVLHLRPGSRPFETLAGRILAARGAAPSSATGPFGSGAGSDSAVELLGDGDEPAGDGDQSEEARLARHIRRSPPRLNLLLNKLADSQRAGVLLFVDQLEELFTLVPNAETRRRFLEAIGAAADDALQLVRVIFTLREEFFSRAAEAPQMREALGRVTVLRSPGDEMLQEVLVRPVAALGYAHDDDEMVQQMVQAVRGEAACLPLLQFASQLLWERRDQDRRVLRRAAYEELGGVDGVLARHADGVLDGLPPPAVGHARSLLLRLVTAEGTRRVLPRTRLLEGLDSGAEEVLDRLVSARLVTVRAQEQEGSTLELVHESLVLGWDRLRRWIEESREDLAALAELEHAAEMWDRRGQRAEEAWQGEALRDGRRAVEGCTTAVPGLVRRFLEVGLARERRSATRRRLVQGVALGLLALVAAAAVVVALTISAQKEVADQQRAEAQGEGARAAARAGDVMEARAKLRGSLETLDSPMARALWGRLAADPLVWKRKLGGLVHRVDYAPDGTFVAVATSEKLVYLLDVRTRAVRRVLRGHKDQVLSLALSARGERLVSGGWDGEVRLWDLRRGAGRAMAGAHRGGVWDVAISPDGRTVASSGADRVIRVWDAASGEALRVLEGHAGAVHGVAFSPDGKHLASAGKDRVARLWDLGTWKVRRVLRGHEGPVWEVAYSPDGKRLATGSRDRTVRTWDASTGKALRVLRGHTGSVWGVAFSPDGARLATGGSDRAARLWDVASGRALRVLRRHEAMVWGIGFSPDGQRLVTGSTDKTVRLWDLTVAGTPTRDAGHTAQVVGLAVAPGGKTLASGSVDRTVRIWDARSGRVLRTLSGHTAQVWGVDFSADGRRLASGSSDRTVRIWDPSGRRPAVVLSGHTAKIFAVAFSPDGKTLASASEDQTVRLWAVPGGQPRGTLKHHVGSVHGVAFSPDGKTLASVGKDRHVRLWDASTGVLAQELIGHTAEVWGVAFSPDGKTLASGGADKTVRLWDLDSGKGRVLGKHEGRVYMLAFHPSGRHVGAPTSTGTARIWDLQRHTSRLLRGHRGEVNTLRFSGELVATSSDDGTVRLWDLTTGQPRWRAPKKVRTSSAGKKPPVAGEPSATTRVGQWIAVGYDDGNLELVSKASGQRRTGFILEDAAASGVTRLLAGPRGTLLAGYANGLVAVWDSKTGKQLDRRRLHGPVAQLQLRGQRLHVASELGGSLTWDLSAFYLDYCRLMGQVWRRVPVAWDGGLPVVRAAPRRHRCATR